MGYVAGRLGLTWEGARKEFDKLESTQIGTPSAESISSQQAQRLGWETENRNSRKLVGALPYRWIRAIPSIYAYLTK
ncbi:hypothetical protein [Sphingobacterium endophyticum]|uniref:hypothetical protein n=1 Tax=Sphingobacterium endophyticum TaxID=2546448 RepID=UPI0012E2A31B|nr:hypothetical protein [Sphingobacterium endophyticum]